MTNTYHAPRVTLAAIFAEIDDPAGSVHRSAERALWFRDMLLNAMLNGQDSKRAVRDSTRLSDADKVDAWRRWDERIERCRLARRRLRAIAA